MIAYFPEIYPGELLYSQLARYYAQSGYTAYRYAAEDLYINKTVFSVVMKTVITNCMINARAYNTIKNNIICNYNSKGL